MLSYYDMDTLVKKRYIPTLQDNFYKGNPFWKKLQAKNKVVYAGGLKVTQPILYGRKNGSSYRGLDTFNITQVRTKTLAEWDWKFNYVNFTIAGTDLAIADSDEKILDYIDTEMMECKETLDLIMSEQIIAGDGNGNGGKDFDGLLNAIDDGTNYGTYGGISYNDADMPTPATLAAAATDGIGGPGVWQSAYYATSSAITIGLVKRLIGKVTWGTDVPDLLLTTQDLYDKLWEQLQPQQRYLNPKSILGAAGFSGLQIDNSQILVDRNVPAGMMLGINTNYFKLVMLKGKNFEWTSEKSPVDADGYVRQLLMGGNLITPARRYHFKAVNLS